LDKSRALITLKLSVEDNHDDEVIKDAYEESVFDQATYFMRRAFIPKLALRRIKVLEDLDSAMAVLGISTSDSSPDLNQIDALDNLYNINNISNLIRYYGELESSLKLTLSNSQNSITAIKAYESWIEAHAIYGSKFVEIGKLNELPFDEAVSMSETIQMSDLINELNSSGSREILIKEYSRLRKLYPTA
jgi:hypothetical protein